MLLERIDVLLSINKLSKVAMIERNLLNRTVAFPSEFCLATLALEKFEEPTLPKVPYWRHRLLQHQKQVNRVILNPSSARADPAIIQDADDKQIIEIKYLISSIMIDKWKVQKIHTVAAILDPDR